MEGEYSPAKPRDSIESIIIPPENEFLSSTEYRTDGEVGYTSICKTGRKRNHRFDSLEEEREKLFPSMSLSLVELACHAAIDIENNILGRGEYLFDNTKKYAMFTVLKKLIQNNIIPGKDIDDTFQDYISDEFMALMIAIGKNSEKERPLKVAQWFSREIQWDDCLSQITSSDEMLELRLLYMELRDLEFLPKERKEKLRDFCVDFSNELGRTRGVAFEKRYAA